MWCGAKDSPRRIRRKKSERAGADTVFAAMRPLPFRRLSPPLLCALAAIVGGVTAGGAAVHGLRQNSYGMVDPPSLFARAEAGVPTSTDGERGETLAAARCDECSERDLGYRWAALAAIRLPGQCPNDSWAFRRGCLDFVGGV